MLLPTSTEYPLLRSNARHLMHDVGWYGVLVASSIGFLAVFASRLGASAFQVSLLTAAPALVNLLASIPFGRWLEGRDLARITFRSSIWARSGYLVLIPLPLLIPREFQIWAVVALTALMSVPGTVSAISFNALFADLIPPEWRAFVVGRRNAVQYLALSAAALACGWLLDHLAFPGNYQWVFTLGAFGALASSYHLGRLVAPTGDRLPPRVGKPLLDAAQPGALARPAEAGRGYSGLRFLTRAHGGRLLRLDLVRSPFGGFLLGYLAFYTFQYLPQAIFPIFWVRELRLTDGAIAFGSVLFSVAMMATSMTLGRASGLLGHRRLLHVSSLAYSVYPFLTWLARDATLFWAASVAGGAVTGFLSGSLVNRLMERVPDDDRPAHMALHNVVLNLGILAGSLLGPALAAGLDLRGAVLGAGFLRLLGGLVLMLAA